MKNYIAGVLLLVACIGAMAAARMFIVAGPAGGEITLRSESKLRIISTELKGTADPNQFSIEILIEFD